MEKRIGIGREEAPADQLLPVFRPRDVLRQRRAEWEGGSQSGAAPIKCGRRDSNPHGLAAINS